VAKVSDSGLLAQGNSGENEILRTYTQTCHYLDPERSGTYQWPIGTPAAATNTTTTTTTTTNPIITCLCQGCLPK
jgi:hypothetical protein